MDSSTQIAKGCPQSRYTQSPLERLFVTESKDPDFFGLDEPALILRKTWRALEQWAETTIRIQPGERVRVDAHLGAVGKSTSATRIGSAGSTPNAALT